MKKLLLFIILVVPLFLLTGCTLESSGSVQQTEQSTVESNQQTLINRIPAPQLSSSLERINIKKRLELWNDENKISYIYLINFGRIVAFHTVKGKVTSGSKRLTTEQKLVNGDYGTNGYGDFVMESASLDGTYGSSGEYVFFWTTEGVYVQWSGDYLLSDEPLKVTIEPLLTRQIK